MHIKKYFIIISSILTFFVVITSLVIFSLLNNYIDFRKVNKADYKSNVLAKELRNTSDDLTRFARTYVITGDSIWENRFWEVLEIRNGIKVRKDGHTIALQDSIIKLGITKPEIDKLKEAEQNSNNLVYTEKVAFNAIKGLYDDGNGDFIVRAKPDTALARRILFDKTYHKNKELIMRPIDDFHNMIKKRTIEDTKKYNTKTKYLILALILILLFTLLFSILIYMFFYKKINNYVYKISKNENKLKKLFQNIGDAMLILENNKFVNCNIATMKLLGYDSIDELLNIHPSEISPKFQPDGLRSFEKANSMIELAKKNGTHRFNWVHKRKNGSSFHAEVFLTKIVDSSSDRMVSIVRDIQFQKENQKQLLKLSAVVEQSFSAIVITDINGNIEYTNPAFKKISGYTFDEVIGKNPRILRSPNMKYINHCDLWETIVKGDTWLGEFLNMKKNGNEYWERAIISSIKNEKGEIINYLAIKYDITEQKKTEGILKSNETHLRLAHKAGKIGSWEWFVIENKLIWSDTNYKIFGIDKQKYKITSELFFSHVHPDDKKRITSELDEAIKTKKTEHKTEYRILKNNKIVWIEETSDIILNEKGELVKMIGIMQDVTDKKFAEQELVKAKNSAEKANNLKSEFLANVSHEIRTPMNAIIGFSEILQNSISDEKQKSFIDKIVISSNDLLNLINEILDLSKIEAGQLIIQKEATDIHLLLDKILSIFSVISKEKNIPLQVIMQNNVPKNIVTDAFRFNQILINLIGNAYKFTSEGSIKLIVQVNIKNDKFLDLFIQVADTGIGIKNDELKNIFEKFRQVEGQKARTYGGTGLGLSITKKLVELLGGEITVTSEPNVGTKFSILFENIEFSKNEIKHEIIVPKLKTEDVLFEKKIKILHVEDNDMNREIISLFIEEYDFELKEAVNGKEALDILDTYIPDIILMDIQMPILNGYEATKIIKLNDKLKQIPILALTANATKEEIEKYNHVFDGYITKPVTKNEFMNAISEFVK